MGWSSGTDIFDAVADALIAAGVDDRTLREVTTILIDKLRDSDWDTWDESLERYTDNPAILEAFHRNGCNTGLSEGVYDVHGELDWLHNPDRWVLRCSAHGELDWEDDTPEGHDRLVILWAAHDKEHHEGDGRVVRSMLCDPSAVAS